MTNETRPLRYVVIYFGREHADYAAHLYAYTAEDAVTQMRLVLESDFKGAKGARGTVKLVEPYREEDHGPWNHPAMDDAGRAHLRIRKRAETGR